MRRSTVLSLPLQLVFRGLTLPYLAYEFPHPGMGEIEILGLSFSAPVNIKNHTSPVRFSPFRLKMDEITGAD
jgi:hypothetical protein